MIMRANVYFRSGRCVELDAPVNVGETPDQVAERLCEAIPANAIFLQVGPHMVFLREVERIEFRRLPASREGGENG